MSSQQTLEGKVSEIHLEKGYFRDYITGKVLRDTPEEKVRQQFERLLVEVYRYDKDQMTIEFPIQRGVGVGKERADIVVFRDSKRTTQENVYIIVETEPPEHSYDLQLLSYVTATPAEFSVWTNGRDIRYFYMQPKHPRKFTPIPDIPKNGFSLEDIGKYRKDQLVSALDLKTVFDRIHNFVYVNQGLRHDQIFHELLKLIFCKVQDEKSITEVCDFRITPSENDTEEGRKAVVKRITRLFTEVKSRYSSVFEVNDQILLESHVLAYAVGELQKYTLLNTDTDVKGTAFETIIGANLRGERGEYFTPRTVCRMMVEMLDPQPYNLVLDPAAGSGGFLIFAVNYVRGQVNHAAEKGIIPKKKVDDIKKEIAERCIFAIDFNPLLAKTTKMNLVMNDASHENVFAENSLADYERWHYETRKQIKPNSYDIVLTNPPMGAKAKIFEREILKQFDLGHKWIQKNGTWEKTDEVLTSQVPEILFIERCLDLLKPGGRLGIVMSRGTLSNEKNPIIQATREYVKSRARILAVVDLPRETFLPHTGTLTSALFIQKKQDNGRDYPVFMAVAGKVGHDKRGNPIFRRDEHGRLILNAQNNPIIDNDLPDITMAYRQFLGAPQ